MEIMKHSTLPRSNVMMVCDFARCVMSLRLMFWSMLLLLNVPAFGQSVILPMPRLTTTMPMGGQVGTTVEVKIQGDYLDGTCSLVFSDPSIVVESSFDEAGNPINHQFQVTIPETCKEGLVEARVKTRLGVSSPRSFSLSNLPESIQANPPTTAEAAVLLQIPSICNSTMPDRSVSHYRIECQKGQRLLIECAAKNIESKLNAVLIIADALGRDLVVERRGDRIDFTAPESGSYIIKVHELTFKGGPEYFFRLCVREASEEALKSSMHGVSSVSAFSWPPEGIAQEAALLEVEPNDKYSEPQRVELPVDLSGVFATAADVDLYEFKGRKGDSWWIEVASERLGRPTDVAVLVQRVVKEQDQILYEDVVELNDIASPVKVSSNHYAYDGPPYNAGSPDVMGEIIIPEDGTYLIRLVDLFGGTRNDPRNIYRMVVRRPAPDFALVAWAMHMELRNGDRNAVSKPMALRNGTTMPLEVVAIRRDGFNGPIELFLENLPDGVSAQGVHIAEGESRGMILITANEGAPAGSREARIVGRAAIAGENVERNGRLASMAWPVKDHWQEIPSPRLLQSVIVSVSGEEVAPLSLEPREKKTWEVQAGGSLTIPLVHLRRAEFSGAVMNARAFGKGLGSFRSEIQLDGDHSEVTIDLSKYAIPAGDHTIAFYGGAVAKYEYYVESIGLAEDALRVMREKELELTNRLTVAKEQVAKSQEPQKSEVLERVSSLESAVKQIKSEIAGGEREVKRCTDRAKPKDIVDIVVSEPIHVRVVAKDKP